MRRIEYKKGDKVGSCEFIKDLNTSPRKALFRCPYCGNVFNSFIKPIKSNQRKSCGCLRGKNLMTHNLSNDVIYNRWLNIKDRCRNKNNKQYKNYGGRGIIMYDKWMDHPELFISYIKSLPGYSVKLTIDRINNDGNYEPGNLRCVNSRVQNINQRKRCDNTSGYTGVNFLNECGLWQSRITVDGVDYYLGRYSNKKDAVKARDEFIIKNNHTEYKTQLI